jgi:Flp pilus assembly protein TadG
MGVDCFFVWLNQEASMLDFKSFYHREEGATAVIAAVAFVLILIVCGLVVDLGLAYYQGGVLQNAADAASYAAAANLPLSVTNSTGIKQIKNTAIAYCVKNGVEASQVNSVSLGDVVQGQYTSVRVRLNRNVNYLFAPIIGISGNTVSKSAKARLESVKSLRDMVPLGIEANLFAQAYAANGSKNVVVKYGAGDGSTGFFGAIDLDGVQAGGAKDFSTWLSNGYQGSLNIGDTLLVESGNMAGPTEKSFADRFARCTHFTSQGGCNATQFDPHCPRVIYLIVYTMLDSRTLRVDGFAPFILESINAQGEIRASHVTVHANDGATEALTDANFSNGIVRGRLVE